MMKQKKISKNNTKKQTTDGFSLVEVTIAIVIMGIGFGTIFNLNTIIMMSTQRAAARAAYTNHVDYILLQGRTQYYTQQSNTDTKATQPAPYTTKIKLPDIDKEATYKCTPTQRADAQKTSGGEKMTIRDYNLLKEEIIFDNGTTYTAYRSPHLLLNPINQSEAKETDKKTPQKAAAPSINGESRQ